MVHQCQNMVEQRGACRQQRSFREDTVARSDNYLNPSSSSSALDHPCLLVIANSCATRVSRGRVEQEAETIAESISLSWQTLDMSHSISKVRVLYSVMAKSCGLRRLASAAFNYRNDRLNQTALVKILRLDALQTSSRENRM